MATADCLTITRELGFDDMLTCPLPSRADSVRAARDVTRSTLADWGFDDLRDDAALVVSELVTNAVRYTRSDPGITLLLMMSALHVLLAVTDGSDEAPRPKEPDFCSENGRGLYIVETYSQRWGWDSLTGGGKAVWALFRIER